MEESKQKECLPFQMDYLPDCFTKKALIELNETPENREVELQKLRDLISADESTTDIEFEVDFLHVFLRYSKYNSPKAFQRLQKFIKLRRNYSNLFQSIPDEYFTIKHACKYYSIFPYRDPDGCAIIYSEVGKWNPEECPLEDLKRFTLMTYLLPLRCPVTQVNGYKAIHDFSDTLKHMKYSSPRLIFLMYNAVINCIPGRYKEMHFVNGTVLLTIIWSVTKPFLSEKMRKRFFFHSKPEDLLNHFPKSLIPTQHGGSLENYHDEEFMKKLNQEYGNYPIGGMKNYF